MEFARYLPVPAEIQKKLIEEHGPDRAKDDDE
jgi:hypothetical protein